MYHERKQNTFFIQFFHNILALFIRSKIKYLCINIFDCFGNFKNHRFLMVYTVLDIIRNYSNYLNFAVQLICTCTLNTKKTCFC